jgi:DDRGK domain
MGEIVGIPSFLIWILSSFSLAVFGGLLFAIWRAMPANTNVDNDDNNRPNRRANLQRLRRAALEQQQQQQAHDNGDEEEDDDNDEEDDDNDDQDVSTELRNRAKKMGKKKMLKLERKEKRRQYNEYVRAENEKLKAKHRRELEEDAERRADERGQEARERARLEEIERQRELDYEQWASEMHVDESGSETVERQRRLNELVDHVKSQRQCRLDDLGDQFDLPLLCVADELKQRIEAAELLGVLDDRGTFTRLSEQQIEALVDIVQQRQAISIRSLATEAQRILSS